jgi:FkbM family methyltransferase
VLLRRFGFARCHAPPVLARRPELLVRSWLPFVVAHELIRNPDLTFLQIGAFDGHGDDDLHELIMAHRLRGLLVEPQPAAFARLKEAYSDQPQVKLLQAAIAEEQGARTLYCRKHQASMAASFDRQHLRRHGIADSDIVAVPVPCHTVASALALAELDRVDLLQIDAEGYDWPIIRSIDLSLIQPAIIRFEYRHMRPLEADACLALLADSGYRFLVESRDIVAVNSRATADLAVSAAGRFPNAAA